MNITLAGSGISYSPDDDQLARTSIELAAFDGEVGNGTLPIPDPTDTLDVPGGRQALIEEGTTLISDGFIVDQDRTKGVQPAGPSMELGYGLMDANALLDGFRISRQRPSETDVARVLAFAAADFPTWDTTWVLASSTVTMPAKKYHADGGWTSELIPDLVAFSGKTLFVHDLADGSGRCLHYHVLTAGHTSGLVISDVISDYLGSATTFFPQQAERDRTSIDLRNNIKGLDESGRAAFASDSASIAAHDADGLKHQAQQDFDATSQGDLNVQTAAFLASYKDELITYTCTIGPLDEDALALIRPGDLITTTSVVMELVGGTPRISHMTLAPFIGEGGRARAGWWTAALEMGAPIRRRARVKNVTKPTPLPPYVPVPGDTVTNPDADFSEYGTWSALSIDGGTATWGTTGPGLLSRAPGTGDVVSDWADEDTPIDEERRLYYLAQVSGVIPVAAVRIHGPIFATSSPSFPQTEHPPISYEIWAYHDDDWATTEPGWDPPTRVLVMEGTLVQNDPEIEIDFGFVIPGGPSLWVQFYIVVTALAAESMSPQPFGPPLSDIKDRYTFDAGWITQAAVELYAFTITGVLMATPVTGQIVTEVIGTGDGVTTAFTTTQPIRALLDAWCNDLPEFDVTQTGVSTVTFGSPPFDGEIIRVRYQAA